MERNVVGARELKARLGTYLRSVRAGRTLIVTDRGQPVAELRPLEPADKVAATLARLEAAGAVTPPRRGRIAAFRQIASRGRSAASAVRADRDDRG